MRNYFLLLGIALLIPHVSFAQSPNQSLKRKVKDAEEKGNFELVLSYSQEILQGDEPDSERYPFLLMAGNAALQSRRLEMAEKFLAQAKALQPDDRTVDYYLAQVAHMHGDYDRAESLYRVAQTPEGTGIAAEQLLKECEGDRKRSAEKNASVSISISERFSKANAADFAGTFHNNDFYYVSHTPKALDEDCNCDEFSNCEGQLQLFSAGLDDETSTEITDWGNNIGQVSFSRDGQSMYFTQCDCQNEVYSCRIYYRELINEVWGKPQLLPKEINQKNTVSTQPYLAYDPVSKKEWLYFATNRREGKDLDIWKAAIAVSGDEVVVERIGPVDNINTDFDEATPFFHTQSNTLYFSSNRPEGLGLGDFDVYSYRYQSGNDDPCAPQPRYLEVINEGAPINSSYDDLYFSLNESGDQAYFSSARDGVDRCAYSRCLDIFEARVKMPELLRTVKVELGCSCGGGDDPDRPSIRELMQGTSVELVAMNDPARSFPMQLASGADYLFFEGLPVRDKYQLRVLNSDYQPIETEFFPLDGCLKDTTLHINMTPIIKWQIFTRDAYLKPRHINAGPLILFEDDQQVGSVSLQQGADFYELTLSPCKQYSVQLTSDSVKTEGCNVVFKPTNSSLASLTNCRSRLLKDTFFYTVEDFDGLPLYFDNGIPRRNDTSPYDALYTNYTSTDRISEFSSCPNNTPAAIDKFFRRDIAENYRKLEDYACYLKNMLDLYGDEITAINISISGFASRLGNPKANKDLSERRIESVITFLKNKIGEKGGKLKYIPKPNGVQGAKDVEGYPCNVFDVGASGDRRISIDNTAIIKKSTR
jgi:hypothetical protein